MHISDGLLPTSVWVGGGVIAAGALALSVRRFDDTRIPQLGVLTGLFFVASSLKIPVPPAGSVHFVLNGLLGVTLGRHSFPCVLVALFFQYVFLAHGGLTTLGVNAVILGGGAAVAHIVFRLLAPGPTRRFLGWAAFLAGSSAVLASAGLFVLVMCLGGEPLDLVGRLVVIPHLPVALLEGVLTASAVRFIARVKPELIPWRDTALRPIAANDE